MGRLAFALFVVFFVPEAWAQGVVPDQNHDLGQNRRPEPGAPAGTSGTSFFAPSHEQSSTPAPLINELYHQLKKAGSAETAARLEAALSQLAQNTGSAAANLLVARATASLKAGQAGTAVERLSAALVLEPHCAELYFLRAQAQFLNDDVALSFADLEKTLALEPRHFGALVSLGALLAEFGQEKQALNAYRQALVLSPYNADAQKALTVLEPQVEGRGI